jgi:hypothetical protein
MKIFFLIAGFMVLAITSYSQENNYSIPLTKDYYLQKSKNQRTAVYILSGVGAVAITIPIFFYENDIYVEGIDPDTGLFSMLIGAVMVVSSIPLHKASEINKRKAMSLSFKNESTPYFQNGSSLTWGVPSLSLKIGL